VTAPLTLPTETLAAFQGDELAARVFYEKYSLRGPDGEPTERTPQEMWARIAAGIATMEPDADRQAFWRSEFEWLLNQFRFLPGGRVLHAIGQAAAGRKAVPVNCFVVPIHGDTLSDIYECAKEMAITYSRGGGVGCIHRGALTITRSGIKPIEQVTTDDFVLSFNPSHNDFKWEAVLQTHQFTVPRDDNVRITLQDRSSLLTSAWHPTLVYDHGQFTYRRADNLKPDDLLLSYTAAPDSWFAHSVHDPDLGWLIGAYLCDGCAYKDRQKQPVFVNTYKGLGIDRERFRLKYSDDSRDVVTAVCALINKRCGTKLTVHPRRTNYGTPMYDLTTNAYGVHNLLDATDWQIGRKARTLHVPSFIWRGSRPTMLAFLAGLLDTDSYISRTRARVTYSTVSQRMAHEVMALVNLLGGQSFLRVRQPHTSSAGIAGRVPGYDVVFHGTALVNQVAPFMRDSVRREILIRAVAGVSNRDVVQLPRDFIAYLLTHPMLNKVATGPARHWLRHHDCTSVRRDTFDAWVTKLLDLSTTPTDRLILQGYRRLLPQLRRVEEVAQAVEASDDFYDLTVAHTNNYLAGFGGFMVVHNTDISTLRPRDSVVHNAAHKSTGAVSFMETFSLVTGTIGQSGRRGALMLTIRDDHPDVLDFVKIKRNKDKVRFANISVLVSDAFMKAVKADTDWRLHYENAEAQVAIERTIRARDLWNELIEGARDWAEPGCLFIDTGRRRGTTEYNGMQVLTTNPCVAGDTLVSTARGLIPIAELASGTSLPGAVLDGRVSETLPTGVIVRAWKSGHKPVLRIITKEGYELRATADHKVLTETRGFVKVQDLTTKDRLLVQNRPGGFGSQGTLEIGRILGWLVGDGAINQNANRVVLQFFGEEKALASVLQASVATVVPGTSRYPAPGVTDVPSRDRADIQSTRLLPVLEQYGFDRTNKYHIPTSIWQGTRAMVRGFIQGLFTADGTVLDASASRRSVRLTSIHRSLLRDVQLLLANFGIPSRVYENRRPAGLRSLPDGRGGMASYECRAYHDLVISCHAIVDFAESIGFLPGSDKQAKLEAVARRYSRGPYRNSFTARIAQVVPGGTEDVYDLTEAVSHTFIANGLTISNCGEQFLDPYSNCNLGALNLLTFVKQRFAELPPSDNINWNDLTRAVHAGVRFLDDVITYSDPLFPLEAQREAARRSRRIGLGITGLGDVLAAVRLRYDSDEAIAFVTHVMEFIKLEAYRASADLAHETSAFPAFDADQHLAQEFFHDFPADLQQRIREVGLRNAALLTVAPTGSISSMAGVTSGIEPIFAFTYQRRSESLSQGSFIVMHRLVESYFKAMGAPAPDLHASDNPNRVLREALPAFFVASHELDPVLPVRMQAAIAAQIDNSVSTTVNLPEDVTKETVSQIYQLAWELGCKGITVYREHSREDILSATPAPTTSSATTALADRVTEIATSVAPSIPGRDGLSPEQHIEAVVRTLAERLRGVPVQLSLVAPSDEPLLPRPESLAGMTHRVRTRMGTMFVTINELDGQPVEVFCRLGKGGTHAEADSEMAGRLISFALRVQTPSHLQRLELIAEQLEGIGGGEPVGFGANRVKSITDGVAKGIYQHLTLKRGIPIDPEAETEENALLPSPQDPVPTSTKNSNGDLCPQCHQYTLNTNEGCTKCISCSYKEC